VKENIMKAFILDRYGSKVVTEVRSDKKTYRYARLVQSYRQDDGMPAQKVVASLGQLEGPEISALRIAL
jgi:hypothetical protein